MGWVFLWVYAVLGLAGAREGGTERKERQEGRSEEEQAEEGARRVDSG